MVELKIQNFEENKKLFLKLKEDLKGLLGDKTNIEHVGSTAIPNMVGKNIIDVLVGAKNEKEFLSFSEKLKNCGYFKSEKSATLIYNFFASTFKETKEGDIHIHLVMENTDRYNDFLSLKDYLLKNPNIAKEYSNFKKEILKKYGADRTKYRQIKSEYVENLIFESKKESK